MAQHAVCVRLTTDPVRRVVVAVSTSFELLRPEVLLELKHSPPCLEPGTQ